MYIVKSRAFRPTFHTFSYLCDIDICKIKVDNSVKKYLTNGEYDSDMKLKIKYMML